MKIETFEAWNTKTFKDLKSIKRLVEDRHYYTSLEYCFNEKQKEIQSLKADNEKLRECVEFYGDDSIWHDINGNGEHYLMISNDSSIDYFDEGIECGGKRARECLKELK